MATKKTYIAWSLRIIVSALFILSALAKLSKGHLLDSPYFAISTFEVKQLYTIGFSEGFAPYFSTIDSGKKILCFFAPGCDHCQGVAKELTEMKQQVKNFPEINIIFMNEEIDLIPSFFKIAGAEYPYKILEIIPFYKVIGMGKSTPGVKYLWNGNEYVFYYGIENNKFNKDDFKALIQKPFSELKK